VINVGWEVSGDTSRCTSWIIERKTSKIRKHKIKKVGSVAGIIIPSKRVEGKMASPFNLLY